MGRPKARASLTGKQIALIHVAKRKLGLEDSEYRDFLEAVCGARSARDVPLADFSYLMERFAELGFVSDFAARSFGHRGDHMATPAHVAKIRQLWRDGHGGELDDKHLDNWLFRQFKVSALRFVDFETARKVLTALNAWNRKLEKKGGKAG